MRIAIVLIVFLACISYSKIMTANLGGKCLPSSKVSGGYTVCHAINVKYNLDKGRISTYGADEDSNVVFMIRFWDAESMRIDFVAFDLQVNKAYADSEYIVPKHIIKDTKFIEIQVYENADEFDPYKETYKCFDADNGDGRDVVPWIVSDTPLDRPSSVKCLPRDTTYRLCKAKLASDDASVIYCSTNAKFAKALDDIDKATAAADMATADEPQEQSTDDYTPPGGWYSDTHDCPPAWQDSNGNCKSGW